MIALDAVASILSFSSAYSGVPVPVVPEATHVGVSMVPVWVAIIAGTSATLAATLPSIIGLRKQQAATQRENRQDHQNVMVLLTELVRAQMALKEESAKLRGDLRAHVRWEESAKYLNVEDVRALIRVHEQDGEGEKT